MIDEPRRGIRVTFPGGAGFQLAGIVDLPPHEPKSFAIFAHCFTCTKDIKVIVRVSRGLAARGFGVLRFDFTGLGNSLGDFSHTNFSTNRADLMAAVKFCAAEYAEPQFLLGHSFGGACALSVANHVTSVLGVAALAAPSDTRHLADLLKRMNPAIDLEGSGPVVIGGQSYNITRQMLDDFRHYDLGNELRYLHKGVSIFHSPEDETLGFEHALRLYSLLTQRPGSDDNSAAVNLISLPGADHLISNHSRDIDFVTDIIAAWFNRLVGQA